VRFFVAACLLAGTLSPIHAIGAEPSGKASKLVPLTAELGVGAASGVLFAGYGAFTGFVIGALAKPPGWGILEYAGVGAVIGIPVGSALGTYLAGTVVFKERGSFWGALAGSTLVTAACVTLMPASIRNDNPVLSVALTYTLPSIGAVAGYNLFPGRPEPKVSARIRPPVLTLGFDGKAGAAARPVARLALLNLSI